MQMTIDLREDALQYVINHVFLPVRLPDSDDHSTSKDFDMCDLVLKAAKAFQQSSPTGFGWEIIVRMVERLRRLQEPSTLDEEHILQSMRRAIPEDVLVFPIRAQNACVILRKLTGSTIVELFEVDPPNADVMGTVGRLVRTFPGPALSIPDGAFNDIYFQRELASFLAQMDGDGLDSSASIIKAGVNIPEVRDTADPRYITQLLTGILCGLDGSRPADIERITKRTRNDILWKDSYKPWRRSPIWLVLRVAIQTTLCRLDSSCGEDSFKAFMIFLMANILLVDTCCYLSNDVLHCMQSKIARRLHKLSTRVPEFVEKKAMAAIEKARKILEDRWKELQRDQAQPSEWHPESLDMQSDTSLSLFTSKGYIMERLNQPRLPPLPRYFEPEEFPRLIDTLQDTHAFTRATLSYAYSRDPDIALIDIEHFVADGLSNWAGQHLSDLTACIDLAECIEFYAKNASAKYKDNPETESIKLLTILQMWVALDRLTIIQHPMLRDYSPEVPQSLLESLLLRRLEFIERLQYVRGYLRDREVYANRSVFENGVTEKSFAIRYFESSDELKRLKQEIELNAQSAKDEKLRELREKEEKYQSYVRDARLKDHEYNADGNHRFNCDKCRLERLAMNMEITVHEWPLPSDNLLAKSTVFELKCPAAFQVWRTTTYMVLHDFCRPPQPEYVGESPVWLGNYNGLQNYARNISRITYASSTKSFLSSHYASQKMEAATADTICVNNALKFALFDKVLYRWVPAGSFWNCELKKLCAFQLPPDSPYSNLQYAVDTTTHTPNMVIANQGDASPELNLHEYMAFCTLRSGPRLQWLNIARELRARVLSFARPEVQSLLLQAAWHVGPISDSGDPEWHTLLTSPDFGRTLLQEIDSLLSSIEDNWLHITTLQTLILLATRLLASSSIESVTQEVCDFLLRCRDIAFKWMKDISKQIESMAAKDTTNDLQRRICAVAFACRATYDVNDTCLHRILNSDKDVMIAIHCLIQIHNNIPPGTPIDLKHPLARDVRLSRSIISILWNKIEVSRKGIDDAITANWSGYRCGSEWRRLPSPNDRWVTTTSALDSNLGAQSMVHLNLLDGTLLINGKSLGRLPSSIVNHSTYIRLLGPKILDVIPSDIPNMDFTTQSTATPSGFHLYFKLLGPNLLIQARREDEVYELIPHDKLYGDFPAIFIEQYTHWLHVPVGLNNSHGRAGSQNRIEFRPLTSRWDPSSSNWHVLFSISGSTMQQGRSLFMVDIRSRTFEMVSNRLKPLEHPNYIHITVRSGRLTADLPRYKLSFILNSSQELESKNFRDMIVDQQQSSGTMIGLTSQLILRPKRSITPPLPRSRCVIIPFSGIGFDTRGYHVSLTAYLQDRALVEYFRYDIDTNLGCLVGTTLLSELYKIYLHASTSYPLPDPLTGRTGIEEALSELGSAKCTSFQTLSTAEQGLLCNIADLVPKRRWYPSHLRSMQSVTWHSIGPLAQHWSLRTHVQHILQFHEQLAMFDTDGMSAFTRGPSTYNDHLYTRSAFHSFYFYPGDYTSLSLGTEHDQRYPSLNNNTSYRSSSPSEPLITRTATISALIQRWPCQLPAVPDLWGLFQGWGVLHNDPDTLFSLSYHKKFLHPKYPQIWIPFYNHSIEPEVNRKAQLTFTLPAMAYDSGAHQELLPIMLAFSTMPEFPSIDAPSPKWKTYDLNQGVNPTEDELLTIIKRHTRPTGTCHPPNDIICNCVHYSGETTSEFDRRHEDHHRNACTLQARELARFILGQWPCERPSTVPPNGDLTLIDLYSTGSEAKDYFSNLFRNTRLREYVDRIQRVLNRASMNSPVLPNNSIYALPVSQPVDKHRCGLHSLSELMQERIPDMDSLLAACGESSDITLEHLLGEFTNRQNPLRARFGRALEESRQSNNKRRVANFEGLYSREGLQADLRSSTDRLTTILNSIKTVLSPVHPSEQAQYLALQWPRITTKSLLGLLSNTSRSQLTDEWRRAIILLAQSMIRLQRAQRLVNSAFFGAPEDVLKELENNQFEQDVAFSKYPEWLLIQIEGNFLVRPTQSLISEAMMSPEDTGNMLLQLNMGEGKTSVIVPLVTSHLADGSRLVRVVVLKPLSNQLFLSLVQRLSGLANRRIFYFPFSREVKLTHARAEQLQSLFELCMRERGIQVIQPEHILSFKLMGIDIATGRTQSQSHSIGEALLGSQRWLEQNSRDILDESDEILSVKYQLVYTTGHQVPLEDHPDRWIRIQEVLSYAKKYARQLHTAHPAGLEVEYTSKIAFPYIRLLDKAAGEQLTDLIAKDLLNTKRFRLLPDTARQVALRFITGREDQDENFVQLQDDCGGNSLWKYIIHLRGLLGCGILQFVFQGKRWRVDYGLDRGRTRLAVPYRAKDVPVLRADFGHPDVAIALTCLSYYYGGLTDDELDTCFQLLFKLDNPALEYQEWVTDHDEVPTSLREIIGVNLDDLDQRNDMLIPLFCKNQATINFYLSNVVFPAEAKQFPKKLSTSSWDLAEVKGQVTVGFSGTNDSRYLLPTSIKQHDRPDQLSTNARVLTYLLQRENDNYVCLQQEGTSMTGCLLLEKLVEQEPPIQVLLDVGAQMLDMQNTAIAFKWLQLNQHLDAVIFFDDHDHLIVMDRDDNIEPFVSSPFNQQLDRCGVYLDDAHTRGTDLKLPKNFRAAVTLGPKVTKDRLVQGCMRMRKLGHGQSVIFFAPLEIDRTIRKLAGIDHAHTVSTKDVLRWVITETFDYIEHHLSHWAEQGVDYQKRNDAWLAYKADPSAAGALDTLRSSWEEDDIHSLEDMYKPSIKKAHAHPAFMVPELNNSLQDLGISYLEKSEMDEEQEREVSHEVERERRVERPPKAEPGIHRVHDDVRSLIINGIIPPGSPAFVPLFSPLNHLGNHEWSESLLATREFATTIQGPPASATDYQRPVSWLLSVPGPSSCLIALSPYEVNELLPLIHGSNIVHLHIYSPRVTQTTKTFEDLKFFCIPQLPSTWSPPSPVDISQLNLWAGQLYLKDYATYSHLCLILGLIENQPCSTEDGRVWWESDGFIKRESRRGDMIELCKFNSSPLPFLKEVFGLRRKGINYSSTHMGKILHDGLLNEDDFRV